jgi:hypothetical protein
MGTEPAYSIRYEHIFEVDCEEIAEDLEDFDRAFRAIEWLIATGDVFRDGWELDLGEQIWILHLPESAELPEMYISFTVEPPVHRTRLSGAAGTSDRPNHAGFAHRNRSGYPQRDSNPCYRLERAGA